MSAITEAFAVLPAVDLGRARAWYADKLGLEPAMEIGTGVIYQFGATRLLLYASPNAGTARSTAAGLIVDDLDAAMAEMRGRGVRFEDYDMDDGPRTVDGVTTDEAGNKAAWFVDSEGNVVNLVQLPPGFGAR